MKCSKCHVFETALQFGYWIKNRCQAVGHPVLEPPGDKIVDRLLRSRRVHAAWTTCGIEWGQHRIVQTGGCQKGQVVAAFCLSCGVRASLDHLPEHCWSTVETADAERPEEVAFIVLSKFVESQRTEHECQKEVNSKSVMMLNAAASLWQAGCEDNRPTTYGPGMPPYWIKRVHYSHAPNVFFGGGAAFCNFCGAISTTGLAGNLFKACRRVTGRPTPDGSISRLVRIRSGKVPVKGQQWPDGRDCDCLVAMKRFVPSSNTARSPNVNCHGWVPPEAPVVVENDIQNEVNRCIN